MAEKQNIVFAFVLLMFILFVRAEAQTTEFTYQGSLKNGAAAATGNFDFEFLLFDASTAGNQIGPTIMSNTVAVTNGTFSVKLDFGSNYPGANRYLEIHVRQTGGGTFTPLTPRQLISSAPYSVKSLNADNAVTATNATQLGGVAANQYVTTTSGGTNFIKNTTSPQAASNFNISGNGIVNGSFVANGNVGIGTSSPNTSLHLLSPSTTGFAIQMENTSTAKRLYIGNYGTVGGGNHWPGLNSANTSFLSAENPLVFNTPGGIYFSGSATAEHMRIMPTGNVGIGATNPASKLQVIATTNDAVSGQSYSADGKGVSGYAGAASGVNFGVYGQSASPNGFGGFFVGNGYFSGNVGLGTQLPAERLHVVGRAIFTVPGNNGFRITPTSDADIGVLNVTNAANTVNWLTVSAGKVIMNGGNVGIGTLSPSAKLEVAGEVKVGVLHLNPNSPISNPLPLCIELNSHIVSRCDFSSLRYKTNIANFQSGLDVVRHLRPITFDWKKDGSHDFGLAAEEVEKVDPHLVVYVNGEVDGVRYDRIGVVLVNAVKEQQAQIEAQKKQIAVLMVSNAELNTRLRHVESRLSNKRISARKRY